MVRDLSAPVQHMLPQPSPKPPPHTVSSNTPKMSVAVRIVYLSNLSIWTECKASTVPPSSARSPGPKTLSERREPTWVLRIAQA